MAARLLTFSSIFWTESLRNCILWPFKLLWYWFNIDSMFPGEIFSKERSLLLFWRKLPVSYASCNGENFIISKRVAFRLLALAVPDPVKMEIKISYPERDIMECTWVIIVFSVNAGNIINTRREVVEAVSLMVFKSLILFVHLEASWN